MRSMRQRVVRLTGALLMVALLIVPVAASAHTHRGLRATGSCATCVAAHVLGVAALPRGVRAESEELRRELEAMRKQLRDVQEQVRKQEELNRRQAEINKRQAELIRKLTAERAAAPSPGAPVETAAAP